MQKTKNSKKLVDVREWKRESYTLINKKTNNINLTRLNL